MATLTYCSSYISILRRSSLLIRSVLVDLVDSSLVHVNDEDQVVSEHGQAVHRGHLDDEGEQI